VRRRRFRIHKINSAPKLHRSKNIFPRHNTQRKRHERMYISTGGYFAPFLNRLINIYKSFFRNEYVCAFIAQSRLCRFIGANGALPRDPSTPEYAYEHVYGHARDRAYVHATPYAFTGENSITLCG